MINRISFSVVVAENSKNHYFCLHENPEQTTREQNAMSMLIAGNAQPMTQNSKLVWESHRNPTSNMWPFEFGESEANMVDDCWALITWGMNKYVKLSKLQWRWNWRLPPKYWTSGEINFEFVNPQLEDDKD